MDTLSRLKGIETLLLEMPLPKNPTLDTLSRLKGIETRTRDFSTSLDHSLDTLSRLKGIETCIHNLPSASPLDNFGYTFPFEGN